MDLRRALILSVHLALALPAGAQQILLDAPVSAGSLTYFPSVSDENAYYYVPTAARLATHENGLPQFSFLRYVQNVSGDEGEDAPREGQGGGIVHAVVRLGPTEEQLSEAKRELLKQRPGATVQGAAIFKSGKFALVSSFANTEGDFTQQVVGLGSAPVLDGGKASISLQLTKLGAKVLWESLHTPTPDVSFSFEMQLEGYRAPTQAVLEADFTKVHEHQTMAAAVATPVLAAEINQAFDDLQKSGAIKLEVMGGNEKLDQMVEYAYRKLTDMMFQPVGGTGTPSMEQLGGGQQRSLLDRCTEKLARMRQEAFAQNNAIRAERARIAARRAQLQQMAASNQNPVQQGHARTELAWHNRMGAIFGGAQSGAGAGAAQPSAAGMPQEVPVPSFTAMAVFEMRKTKRTEKYRLDLNQSLPDQLPVAFSENLGDLRKHLEDEAIFRSVNLDDPFFRQREIAAFVDGANADDFTRYINFVTLEVRKQHENGDVTIEELRIDKKAFTEEGNAFSVVYGWKEDHDRGKWLRYDHRTVWSFFGGASVEEPWKTTTAGAVNLTPPYLVRTITLEGEPEVLKEENVRAVTAKIFSDLAGKEQVEEITLRPRDQATATLDVILPTDSGAFEYQIDWRIRGNKRLSTGRQKGDSTVVFIDELPEPEPEAAPSEAEGDEATTDS